MFASSRCGRTSKISYESGRRIGEVLYRERTYPFCPPYDFGAKICDTQVVSAAPFQALPLLRVTEQGITPFLEANSNYSIFLELLEASGVYSELVTGAWMQVPFEPAIRFPSSCYSGAL